jgi:GT2 family glycosyltransferase
VLLFTDDDVVPAENWLERMSAPLLENHCDAVSGRVVLAEQLRRPWLTRTHALWLAERVEPASQNPELVGASMGIRREVFDRIPGFDLELGPGVTGLGEDTLLWMRMMEMGMRILPVLDTVVVHHPDRSRLNHASWVAAARQQGRTYAYIWHHWKHLHVANTLVRECWNRLKLTLRVLLTRGGRPAKEGCPEWELSYRTRIETFSACRKLAGKPRNYPPPDERI